MMKPETKTQPWRLGFFADACFYDYGVTDWTEWLP